MTKEKIVERIDEIKNQIHSLTSEKNDLENELINSESSFLEKFKIWWYSDLDTETEDWVPAESEYPYLMKMIDRGYPERHRTYDLTEYLEEEFDAYLFDPVPMTGKDYEDYAASELQMDPLILYTLIATELFKGKLKAFTYDW